MHSKKTTAEFWESSIALGLIIVIVALFYFGAGAYMWFHYFRTNPSFAGTFGDMFGGITSFFSAVTVVLVFYASRLQKQELDATRQEFIEQNETTSLQRFETTFFNLLQLYNQIKKEVSFSPGTAVKLSLHEGSPTRYEGARAFDLLNRYWNKRFKTDKYQTQYTGGNKVFFEMQYNDGLDRDMEIPHYYSHVMNTFIFIMEGGLSKKQTDFYAKIFTTLLSPVEVALLYYYVALQRDVPNELRSFIISQPFFHTIQGDKYFADVSYWNFNYPDKVRVTNRV